MEKIHVKMKYCYGIKSLDHEFVFSKENMIPVYAPNGIMKTSFAKTFQDFATGDSTPRDEMFPARKSIFEIEDENGKKIKSENIFVARQYMEDFESDKTATLLAKEDLRKKWKEINNNIDIKKILLLDKLKHLSGFTGRSDNIELEIEKDFDYKNLYEIIKNVFIEDKSTTIPEIDFSNIIYKNIFNEDTLEFVLENKNDLREYASGYHKLLSNSIYFRDGFNHYKALKVNKSLEGNNFYNAGHTIILLDNKGKKLEVQNSKKFEEIIKKEKESIFSDESLNKKFLVIDKKIKNQKLEDLREYLKDNKEILVELSEIEMFKKTLWITYLKKNEDLCLNFLTEYTKCKKDLEEIIKKVKNTETEWQSVVNEFNRRFSSMPFKISIGNQKNVILKMDTPFFEYTFKDKDTEEEVKKTKQELIRILSSGEKKALYILQLIFEINSRKKGGTETLLIIDDITDSFDYRNKYAIIQYLKDISSYVNFKQIILTHNFDFFRTIIGRVGSKINYNKYLLATRGKNAVILNNVEKMGIINPFQDYKQKCIKNTDEGIKKCLALIPFIRNLIEYSDYESTSNPDYELLTNLLHIKNKTGELKESISIKINDISHIFKSRIGVTLNFADNFLVIEKIYKIAESIKEDDLGLENNIVLAIAIRLKAEEFMIKKINDDIFMISITSKQTERLIDKFKKKFSEEKESIKILDEVQIMTPENIHINTFMYEPILDMTCYELIGLYKRVKDLK